MTADLVAVVVADHPLRYPQFVVSVGQLRLDLLHSGVNQLLQGAGVLVVDDGRDAVAERVVGAAPAADTIVGGAHPQMGPANALVLAEWVLDYGTAAAASMRLSS